MSYAANLTPDINTGIGIWTEEMFVKAMRTGRHMGGGRDLRNRGIQRRQGHSHGRRIRLRNSVLRGHRRRADGLTAALNRAC